MIVPSWLQMAVRQSTSVQVGFQVFSLCQDVVGRPRSYENCESQMTHLSERRREPDQGELDAVLLEPLQFG